ncbi:MAG: hypothetical protein ACK4N5_03735 [Myxococcales bacterium]
MQTRRLFPLVALLALAGCASGGARAIRAGDRPSWVDGKDARYPGERAVLGVGLAQITKDATSEQLIAQLDSAARAELVKKLQVSVSSEVSAIEAASSSGGDSFSVETRTREVVENFDLTGVEIVDRWRDDDAGVVYALAVLDKAKFVPRLQAKMMEAERIAGEFAARGDAAVQRDPGSALRHYLQARAEADKANQAAVIYRVLTGQPAPGGSAAKVAAKVTELLVALKLEVVDGDRQRAQDGKPLARPVVFSATLARGEEPLPVSGLPLLIDFRGGRVDPRVATDPSGRVAVAVQDAGRFTTPERRLVARLDWHNLLGLDPAQPLPAWTSSRPIEASATLIKKSKETTRVIVKILETIEGGTPVLDSLVQSTVVSALTSANVVVQDPKELVDRVGGEDKLATMSDLEIKEKARGLADVIIIGSAHSKFSSVYSEPAIWHRAHGVIRAIDLGSGQVIANVDVEVKGDKPGIGPDKAGKQALKALSPKVAAELTAGVLKGLGF